MEVGAGTVLRRPHAVAVDLLEELAALGGRGVVNFGQWGAEGDQPLAVRSRRPNGRSEDRLEVLAERGLRGLWLRPDLQEWPHELGFDSLVRVGDLSAVAQAAVLVDDP